jgi:hypothetical protein
VAAKHADRATILRMTEPFPVDVRPDLLDWITALGTAGATILAVIAIGMQLADRRRVAEEERRRQAELVSAWVAPQPYGPLNAAGEPVMFMHKVHVRNGSEEVIYRAWLHPTEKDRDRIQPVEVGIVSPRDERVFDVDDVIGDPWTIPFELDFVDARGQHWTRHADGRLSKRKSKKKSAAAVSG